jgi:hypothetical protein
MQKKCDMWALVEKNKGWNLSEIALSLFIQRGNEREPRSNTACAAIGTLFGIRPHRPPPKQPMRIVAPEHTHELAIFLDQRFQV